MGDPAARLRGQGLDPGRWLNGPGDRYATHEHGYDKVIVVEHGSIVFGLPDQGTDVELRAGDRLDLPAHTRHDASVGPQGVVCLEAHVPDGRLGGRVLRRRAGEW